MGNYSTISGVHRVEIPAAGSKMAMNPLDYRPSWAKPNPPPISSSSVQQSVRNAMVEKPSTDNEQTRVKRQLEAELQA